MRANAEHASLVTLFDSRRDVTSSLWKDASIITLPHPSTGVDQHFVKIQCDLYEMQSLSRLYGSFLVGSRVISNGALHVMTRIDPLFFILRSLSKASHQWQPLDQLEVPSGISVELGQWKHLYVVKHLGDDLILYKFSPEKALAWLVKKQEAAHGILCQQLLDTKQSNEKENLEGGGGAFSNNFKLADDEKEHKDKNTTPETTKSHLSCTERGFLKEESVQVVCEYLEKEWQCKLRNHLGLQESEPASNTNKRSRASWEANPGQDDANQLLAFTMGTAASTKEEDVKKKEPAKSAGLKRLAKVNTKGMKSLSNFFGSKKKAKK